VTVSSRGTRLVTVGGAAWAAAAYAVLFPSWSGAAAGVLAGAAGASLLLVRRRRGAWPAVAAVALAAAACTCGTVAAAQVGRAEAATAVGTDARGVVAVVTVTGRLDPSAAGDVWFDARASALGTGPRAITGDLPVRVGVPPTEEAGLADADLGTVLSVRGVSLRPDAGAREVAVIRASRVEVVEPTAGVWHVLAGMRAGFAQSAARLPDPGAALIPGLAVGDTSAVDAAAEQAMKASSLTHLTAVSGANCAIVVGLAFGGAALLGATRGLRIAAGMAALALFVLLVTPEPSVVRAAAMATIAMLAVGLGRSGSGLAVLGLAVALLLAVDPWLALEWGFALSVVATASLLVLARPLAARLSRALPDVLATAVAVPLAAQLACSPLLVLLDPQVPVLGVIANLLAAPAAPVATVLGLLACLAGPFPALQDGLSALAWVPASWIAGVAHTVAGIPAQRLPWLEGIPGAVLLAMLSAAVIVAIVARPGVGRLHRTLRAVALGAVALAAGIAAGQSALVSVAAPWTVPHRWQVAMCDVGQGDAILIRSAAAVALVDTGPDPEPLRRCLDRFGVARIDLLVLTHFDADHAGGADAVLGRVETVWHGPPDADGGRLLAALERGGARTRAVVSGDTVALGSARLRVHWPAPSYAEPGNDASVAVDVLGGRLPSVLLLGDLGEESQTRMRAAARLSAYDVVKVAHHGSADQDAALYHAVDADLALIAVGADNDYGHPRPSLLGLLQAAGARIARTDTDGAVAVWREGDRLRLWRERGVAPDR
jgi:competence protein ComEC